MKVLSSLSLLLLLLLSLPSSSYLASRGLVCRSRASRGLQCYGNDEAPGDSDYGSTAVDDVSIGIGSCGLEEGICQLKLDKVTLVT
jgi:hypothetical protein